MFFGFQLDIASEYFTSGFRETLFPTTRQALRICLFFAFAVPLVEILNATTFTSLRSMASKLVPSEEMGKFYQSGFFWSFFFMKAV